MNELIITSGILVSAICVNVIIAYYQLKKEVETAKEELNEAVETIKSLENSIEFNKKNYNKLAESYNDLIASERKKSDENQKALKQLKESRRKIKFTQTDIENMQRMKRRDYSNEKIAKHFGVSDETIRLRLKELK
jgi:chromosome segregation ATPase